MKRIHDFSELDHIIRNSHDSMRNMKFSSKSFYATMQKRNERLFFFVRIDEPKAPWEKISGCLWRHETRRIQREKPILTCLGGDNLWGKLEAEN